MPRRCRISLVRPKLRNRESEIIEWMGLGCGIWAASQMSDVSLCKAMSWLEHGERHPDGRHGDFALQLHKIGVTSETLRESEVGNKTRHGRYSNGNGSVRWDD
jgi:hypothetical protein